MPLPSTGSLSLSQLQSEFGGNNPISLSEYLRGGSFVPNTPNSGINQAVPTGLSNISVSKYRSTSKTVVVTYEIIGGGGGGGAGDNNGGEEMRGSFAPAGGNSSISGSGMTTITAEGGRGGENGKWGRGQPGTAGGSTFYGPGGTGGDLNSTGGSAAATSYGAAGGGGGGDSGALFDSGGVAGEGGVAGTRLTGTFTIPYGSTIFVNLGTGGAGSAIRSPNGGAGAGGYCRLTYNGFVVPFTTSGTRLID